MVFDMLSAGVLGLTVSLVATVSAFAAERAGRKKNSRSSMCMCISREEDGRKKGGPAPAQNTPSGCVSFSQAQLHMYRDRMISTQPIDNDRILPGYGKTHTLSAIAEVARQACPIPTAIEQVGDVFS